MLHNRRGTCCGTLINWVPCTPFGYSLAALRISAPSPLSVTPTSSPLHRNPVHLNGDSLTSGVSQPYIAHIPTPHAVVRLKQQTLMRFLVAESPNVLQPDHANTYLHLSQTSGHRHCTP